MDYRKEVHGDLRRPALALFELERTGVDHSDDPQRQADIAREELGLVAPGEKVIVFTD